MNNMGWAFVPDHPKPLTPARRGCPVRGHGVGVAVTCRVSRSQSIAGFGVRKFRCLGMIPWFIARMTLITPATPAADSRWPMFVFTDLIMERLILISTGAVGCAGRFRLNRVSDLCARSMRFHIVHLRRRDVRLRQRGGNYTLLCCTAGHRQSRACSIPVQGHPSHHSPDTIPISLGLSESLEYHYPAPFAPHISVCSRIKGLAKN